jgi:hypothetical protein
MIELLLLCEFDILEYSWVKVTIGICTLADYSVAKKHQHHCCRDPVLTPKVSPPLHKHIHMYLKQGLGPLLQALAVEPPGAGGLIIGEQGLAV